MKTMFTSKLKITLLCFMAVLGIGSMANAQVTVAQWNGFTQGVLPTDNVFRASDGISANKGTATLVRDAAGANYAINADGIVASQGWADATSTEKYWLATFTTTGYESLKLTSKQRGSNTGPANFKIQYKVGSGVWTDLETVTVANDNYLTGVVSDLALPSALADQSTVSLRWLCTSTTSINGNVVAAGGVNRLDVVVTGTVKSGVVVPTIEVSPASLTFSAQNEQQEIIVTGKDLTSAITLVSSNPLFVVNPTTVPADIDGGEVSVTFTGTESATGTITLTSGTATTTVALSATILNPGGLGTKENPYDIDGIRANQGAKDNKDYFWVEAYIVGTYETATSPYVPNFDGPYVVNTNILIAASPSETNIENCIPVQLPSESVAPGVRTALNLVDNADIVGKRVLLEGTFEAYFSMPGLKNTRAFDLGDVPVINVSETSLEFVSQNQEKTVTVTGANLKNDITIVSDNALFTVSVVTLPAASVDAELVIKYTGTANATGTVTLTSGTATKVINVSARIATSGNDGSYEKPYTLAELVENQGAANNGNYFWVEAYIVGTYETLPVYKVNFDGPYTTDTNILIAATAAERDSASCVPVQLPAESKAPGVRANLNLMDNSDNVGKKVKLEGTFEAYFKMAGLKNARAYEFVGTSSVAPEANESGLSVYSADGVVYVKGLASDAVVSVYDMTGKLVATKVAAGEAEFDIEGGLYIVKVVSATGSKTAKVINK